MSSAESLETPVGRNALSSWAESYILEHVVARFDLNRSGPDISPVQTKWQIAKYSVQMLRFNYLAHIVGFKIFSMTTTQEVYRKVYLFCCVLITTHKTGVKLTYLVSDDRFRALQGT